MSTLESGLVPIKNAIRRGLDGVAVQLAIRRGITDENRITDIVFAERHKELRGRRIGPNERALAHEWRTIRSTIVRPALQAARSATTATPATTVPSTPVVRPAVPGAPLDELRALSGRDVAATEANAVRILRALGAVLGIPWQLPYTVLEHEGGVRLFPHNDGVMQTISVARDTILPRLPRDIKLAVIGLPASDTTTDAELVRTLHAEFHRRLAVQIAAGTHELATGLRNFNGYIALACVAYNAGTGSATHIVRRAGGPQGATGTPEKWERACFAGARLLHQPVSAVVVAIGQWQCDKNLASPKRSGWYKRYGVTDRATGIQLIAFQYLRSVTTQIRRVPPTIACEPATHKKRLDGSGAFISETSRWGMLDKLFDPGKLKKSYREAATGQLAPIADDGTPLRIVNGQVAKVAQPAAP
jgi:hypothetical protein